jgi:hypothetical protein
MAAIFAFHCRSCGELHEGSPSFGYPAPLYYSQLPESERAHRAHLTSDTCIIDNEDRFIRTCLEVPIRGVDEPFLWGVWVSLSEESFQHYLDTWDDPDESTSYFGWFGNRLPFYPDTVNLKTQVRPRRCGARPYLTLEDIAHPLCVDWQNGIDVARTQALAEAAMHGVSVSRPA